MRSSPVIRCPLWRWLKTSWLPYYFVSSRTNSFRCGSNWSPAVVAVVAPKVKSVSIKTFFYFFFLFQFGWLKRIEWWSKVMWGRGRERPRERISIDWWRLSSKITKKPLPWHLTRRYTVATSIIQHSLNQSTSMIPTDSKLNLKTICQHRVDVVDSMTVQPNMASHSNWLF